MPPVIYLLDGYAIAYRQYFGLPVASFSTRKGEPTNAVYGFTRVLLDILEKDKPNYLAVSFDMGMSGRETLYEAYKGTREKMETDLEVQLPRIAQVVEAFNIPILALEGYEADDVIGTVTQQAQAQGVQVRIITGDRDLLQLLNDQVIVQLPTFKGEDELYDVARFTQKYGVRPDQWVDMKALMGDNSDNIPGVKGIGEKGALKLLTDYDTLDGIYANLDQITGANHKKLLEGRDSAYLSRELARLRLDVPITLNLEKCVTHDYQSDRVLKVFEELEFRGHRDRVLKITTPSSQSMFDEDSFIDPGVSMDHPDYARMMGFAAPSAANSIVQTVIVREESDLQAMLERLTHATGIVFDTETTSTDQMAGELVGIALSIDGEVGYYIPVGHQEGRQLPLQRVIDVLRAPLTDPNIPKYAHNATYDHVMLYRYGIDVTPITFDTMIAEWLIDPDSKNLGLKNLTAAKVKDDTGKSVAMTEIKDLIGTGKTQITMDKVPIDRAAPYAAADAVMTYRLVQLLDPQLRSDELLNLYQTLEIPLIPVLSAIERAGVVLDVPYLRELSGRLEQALKKLEEEIYQLSGGYGKFNINSPKQLNDVLFGKLGLPTKGLKKTTHGYSTDAPTLENFTEYEIVRKILEYRELAKLKGTYVDALPELINAKTGRLHTSYNQTGTNTGRLSSSDPNLQNIPIRTEIGREVRRAFIAPEGSRLVSIDYSQVELRIMAHISRDATLLDAFQRGLDIHAATAAAVYGVPVETVTKQQRNFAKRVNFGLLYGMGAFRLARDSDLTLQEADAFIKRYFERLPGVQKYINDTKRAAREKEGLVTLMGRRRYFPNLINGRVNKTIQAAEERAAINMPIQGSAADIMKRAMIDVYAALQREGLRGQMILQVHDELVFEVPEAEVETLKTLVVSIMENAYPLDPALRANAGVGRNWRDLE
ncbi:MAG: DNA polymerase I [Anaerolineae bacterium]|nr:DNA polymerase I [Anaerolineae bacterium]